MVRVEAFDVERWMDEYEHTAGVLNVAETCAASVSIDELTALSGGLSTHGPIDTSIALTYGVIPGSLALRKRISATYGSNTQDPLSPDEILVTQGAIGANFLTFYTLVSPGDHVICVYPTYQQLYAVPKSLGAEVTLWNLRKDNGYVPDVAELESLVRSNTKVRLIAKI
jgi:DNA-binding transcriptional MocR family regulator